MSLRELNIEQSRRVANCERWKAERPEVEEGGAEGGAERGVPPCLA